MKLTVLVQNTFLNMLTPIPRVSGNILSSKTSKTSLLSQSLRSLYLSAFSISPLSLSLCFLNLSALSISPLSQSLCSLYLSTPISLSALSYLSLLTLSFSLSLFLSLSLSLGVMEDRMVPDTIGIGVNMLRYVF